MNMQYIKRKARELFIMFISCTCFALAIDLFVAPNKIIGGGVTGLSLIINTWIPIGVGLVAFAMNIPMFIFGIKIKGLAYIGRCLMATAILNFLIDTFSFLPAMTQEPLMAALFAGMLCGISVGINYKYNVSSGGTELLAQFVIAKNKNASIGNVLATIDGAIVILGSIVLHNPENLLLALIMIITSGKVSNMIVTGFDYANMCYIITTKEEEIVEALTKQSERGITSIQGMGMYSKCPYRVLMTVIKKKQFSQLKETVFNIDASAFVIVSEATEVLGRGFKQIAANR